MSDAAPVPPIVTEQQCAQWGYHGSIWPSILASAAAAQAEGKFTDEATAESWVRQAFPKS